MIPIRSINNWHTIHRNSKRVKKKRKNILQKSRTRTKPAQSEKTGIVRKSEPQERHWIFFKHFLQLQLIHQAGIEPERFPGESELREKFEAVRITVRRALDEHENRVVFIVLSETQKKHRSIRCFFWLYSVPESMLFIAALGADAIFIQRNAAERTTVNLLGWRIFL